MRVPKTKHRSSENLESSGKLGAAVTPVRSMPLAGIVKFAVLIAQHLRESTSVRVRESLAHIKAEGKIKLGNPRPDIEKMNSGARKARVEYASKMRPIIAQIRSCGISTLEGIASALSRLG